MQFAFNNFSNPFKSLGYSIDCFYFLYEGTDGRNCSKDEREEAFSLRNQKSKISTQFRLANIMNKAQNS